MIVELIIILLGLAFTVGITFVIPVGNYYHYWAPFLLLIAGYLIGLAIVWGILTIFSLPYGKNSKKRKRPSKFAQFWLSDGESYVCRHARVKLKIKNNTDAALPKERFLIICNHLSKFDPMIMGALYGKKHDLAFISKPTNFNVPVGGKFMRGAGYLSIDRFDKLKSLEIIKEAQDLIANNYASIGVFPEGTRSEDEKFHEFHEGVFSIALKTKCPIVVTTIKNTQNIHKNFPKRRTVVEFEIIKILFPEDYEGMIAKTLSDHCHELMLNSLGE